MRQALGSAAGSKLVAMSLDGLRAWIGLVERKLTMRTRVFLVLVAIAVGGAAAGIYLAIDAQNNSVSKADVEAVCEELAGESGSGGSVAQLESQLQALRDEVAALQASESGKATNETAPGSSNASTAAPKNPKQLEEAFKKAEEQAGK